MQWWADNGFPTEASVMGVHDLDFASFRDQPVFAVVAISTLLDRYDCLSLDWWRGLPWWRFHPLSLVAPAICGNGKSFFQSRLRPSWSISNPNCYAILERPAPPPSSAWLTLPHKGLSIDPQVHGCYLPLPRTAEKWVQWWQWRW